MCVDMRTSMRADVCLTWAVSTHVKHIHDGMCRDLREAAVAAHGGTLDLLVVQPRCLCLDMYVDMCVDMCTDLCTYA